MSYRLIFAPTDKDIFETVYEGFALIFRPATREEHKTSNAILDKLEATDISYLDEKPAVVRGFDPSDPNSPKARHLVAGGGYIILSDNHYRTLKEVTDKLSTPAPMSRLIGRIHDWIDSAKQGDEKSLVQEMTAKETISEARPKDATDGEALQSSGIGAA